MNIFALILGLVPGIVKGIQVVVGDKASGADKSKMAHDALQAAVEGTASVLTGTNLKYSEIAGAVAQVAIDQTVSIAKATGAYDKWTAASTAVEQDVQIADNVIKAINTPPAPVAPVQTTIAPSVNEAPGVAHQ